MNTQKGFSKISIILLIIILIIAVAYFYKNTLNKEEMAETVSVPAVSENLSIPKEDKGIVITLNGGYSDPVMYKLPINITGHVSDLKKWQVFEGSAGVAKLYAKVNGVEKQIAIVPLTLKDFEYGKVPVYFDINIGDREYMSNLSDNKGYIIFEEENAKGDEVFDTIKLPVLFDVK